jgi:hypothetical protein
MVGTINAAVMRGIIDLRPDGRPGWEFKIALSVRGVGKYTPTH